MNTPHDREPLDLGSALHQIADQVSDRVPFDVAAVVATARATTMRARRRRYSLIATSTAGVLVLGGGAWAALPGLVNRDPEPIVTITPSPTPTPSLTPTQEPEPSPEPTVKPTETAPVVPNGFTSEIWTPEESVYDVLTPVPCGDPTPAQTGAERLAIATVPNQTIRVPAGADMSDVPVTVTVLDTVTLEAEIYSAIPLVSQNGVVMSQVNFGDDHPTKTEAVPGEVVKLPTYTSWLNACGYIGPDPSPLPPRLEPGTYEVTFMVYAVFNGYSLQQQDGTWGTWQDISPIYSKNFEDDNPRNPTAQYLLSNTVTLVIE